MGVAVEDRGRGFYVAGRMTMAIALDGGGGRGRG